jgi:hypothetical protein
VITAVGKNYPTKPNAVNVLRILGKNQQGQEQKEGISYFMISERNKDCVSIVD